MIPVNEPKLGPGELANVTAAVEEGWISSAGRFLEAFESGWARYCGREHGIAVTNGTTALELALGALEIGEGDEVILPSFTIISCALAVVRRGATPVLVDCDPDTWCMDLEQVAERMGPRTRAVMPVHMYGHPVEMEILLTLCAERAVAVVEDAAEAHGAEVRVDGTWRRAGSCGALSTFSFYANKLVTTGEGGMVVTDDEALAERCRSLRNLCFIPGRRFVHEELGYNFRMTNLQAALGAAQIERMDDIVATKRRAARRYLDGLGELEGVRLQAEREFARSVWWMFGLVLEREDLDAAQLAAALRERGVDTRPFFVGMHAQPALRQLGLFGDERYPVTDWLTTNGLYLPSGLALTDGQQDHVIGAVREVLG